MFGGAYEICCYSTMQFMGSYLTNHDLMCIIYNELCYVFAKFRKISRLKKITRYRMMRLLGKLKVFRTLYLI